MAKYPAGIAHASDSNDSAVERRRAAAEQMRGSFAHVAPGVNLADELIADRQAESRKDPWTDSDPQPGDFDEELDRARGNQIELHEGNPDATVSKLESAEDDA